MVCFGNKTMSDKQAVKKMSGNAVLLNSVNLKSILKSLLAYNNKDAIKEQSLSQLRNQKLHFIRTNLNITNISLINSNILHNIDADDSNDNFNMTVVIFLTKLGIKKIMMMAILTRVVLMMKILVMIIPMMLVMIVVMMVVINIEMMETAMIMIMIDKMVMVMMILMVPIVVGGATLILMTIRAFL